MTCWQRRCRGWRCTRRASAGRFPAPAAACGAAWPTTSSIGALRRARCGQDHQATTQPKPPRITPGPSPGHYRQLTGRTDPATIDVPHRRITSGCLAGRTARDLGRRDAAVTQVRAQARVVIGDLQGKFPATSRSTAAQPSPGTASACQHVTSDRKIPSSRKLPRFGAVVTTAATPCTRAPRYASTGHVWITVWRRHGLNPFPLFSQLVGSLASGLVTGAWPPGPPGMFPGIAPPSGRIAQFIHNPYTQPPTRMTSPGRA